MKALPTIWRLLHPPVTDGLEVSRLSFTGYNVSLPGIMKKIWDTGKVDVLFSMGTLMGGWAMGIKEKAIGARLNTLEFIALIWTRCISFLSKSFMMV